MARFLRSLTQHRLCGQSDLAEKEATIKMQQYNSNLRRGVFRFPADHMAR